MSNQYQQILDVLQPLDKEASIEKDAFPVTTALLAALAAYSAYSAAKSGTKAYKAFKKGDTKEGWKHSGWAALDTLGAVSGTGWLAPSISKGAKLLGLAAKLRKASQAAKLAGDTVKAAKLAGKASKLMSASNKLFKSTKAAVKLKNANMFKNLAGMSGKQAVPILRQKALTVMKAANAAKRAGSPQNIKALTNSLKLAKKTKDVAKVTQITKQISAANHSAKTAKSLFTQAKDLQAISKLQPNALKHSLLSRAASSSTGVAKVNLTQRAAAASNGAIIPAVNARMAAGAHAITGSAPMQALGKGLSATGRGFRIANRIPVNALAKVSPGAAAALARGGQAFAGSRPANIAKAIEGVHYSFPGIIADWQIGKAMDKKFGPREPVSTDPRTQQAQKRIDQFNKARIMLGATRQLPNQLPTEVPQQVAKIMPSSFNYRG